MASYAPTDEEQQLIRDLEEFRDAVTQWSQSSRSEERQKRRSLINRRVDHVREIVTLAGCRHMLTIVPPPAIGGVVMPNVDPFRFIFEGVYGRSLNSNVFDMLDQTIGIIEGGKSRAPKSPPLAFSKNCLSKPSFSTSNPTLDKQSSRKSNATPRWRLRLYSLHPMILVESSRVNLSLSPGRDKT